MFINYGHKSYTKSALFKRIFYLAILLIGILIFPNVYLTDYLTAKNNLLSIQTPNQAPNQTPIIKHLIPSSQAMIDLEDAHIDKVFVDKSKQTLSLLENGQVIRTYHIALGDNPKGHKLKEGDERTPEGVYTLDYKNEHSIAYRSIHVNYPNEADKAKATSLGIDPSGNIMIHGQMNGAEGFTELMQQQNWTDGCMAVTNDEMDEIMDAVQVGTPIEIVW